MTLRRSIALLLTATLAASCTTDDGMNASNSDSARVAIIDGVVWTGVPGSALAEAVLVEGDRITFVGSTASVLERAGDAHVVSANGGSILPGFIDSHVHLLEGGYRLSSVQLRDASTPEEFSRRIGAYAATIEPGEWITGGDWDHELWGGELPHRKWIDELTPDNPVWVNRLDGHMALANSLALEIAGIDNPGDVAGGTIERDADGLTGVFKDNAMALVGSHQPTPSLSARERALHTAMRYLAAQGVTSVHDMDGSSGTFEALRSLRDKDSLTTRVYLATPLSRWRDALQRADAVAKDDHWLRVGALKGFVDGSLGSHTAAFFDPFTDAPDDRGLLVVEPDAMYEDILAADREGLQLMIHAIGDRANALLLDMFERLAAERGPRDRRPRIEHAQHLRPSDIPKFASLDVIASMQPYHAIDDGRWADRVIGAERARTTYAFRSLLDAGARVSFGSDWFVAPPTPLEGIAAAVTRQTLDGRNPGGWVPEQRISVAEALVAYTRSAAYAEFQENLKGTLEVGKLADIVVLDRDILAVNGEDLKNASVAATFVGGELVFGAADVIGDEP